MINFFKNLFKKEENKNNKKEKTSIQNLDLKGLEKTYYENQLLENIEVPNPQDRSSVKLHTNQGGHIKKLEIDATAIKHIVNEARLAKEVDDEQLKRQKLEKLQKSMDDYANIIASRVLDRARPKIQEAAEKLINEIEKRNRISIKEEIEPIRNEITEIKSNIKEIKDAITENLPKNEYANEFNENIENLTEQELVKDHILKEKEETDLTETEESEVEEIVNNQGDNLDNLKEEIKTESQQNEQVHNTEPEAKVKTENNQEQENTQTQENPEDQIKAILQKAKEKKQQQTSDRKDDPKKQNIEQNKENKQIEQTTKPDTQKSIKTNNTQSNKNSKLQNEKEEKRKKKIEKIIKEIKANIKLIENMKKIEEKEKELKILKQLINNEFKNDKEAIEIILKETNLEKIESKLKNSKEETLEEKLEKRNNDEITDSVEDVEDKTIDKDINNIEEQKLNYYLEEILKIKEHINSNLDSLKSQYIYIIIEKFKQKIEKEPNKNEILNAINPELNEIIETAKRKENDENQEAQTKSKKTDLFDTTLEKNIGKETKIIHNLLEKAKEIRHLNQELIKLQEIEMEREENDNIFK
jgi:hypothetical protein